MTDLSRRQTAILTTARQVGHARLRSANDRRSADALERRGLGRRDGPIFYPNDTRGDDVASEPASMHRTAIIEMTTDSLDTVRRYLPGNYEAEQREDGAIVITGEDVAGWTLDGYVLPRLASGLIFAREVSSD